MPLALLLVTGSVRDIVPEKVMEAREMLTLPQWPFWRATVEKIEKNTRGSLSPFVCGSHKEIKRNLYFKEKRKLKNKAGELNTKFLIHSKISTIQVPRI